MFYTKFDRWAHIHTNCSVSSVHTHTVKHCTAQTSCQYGLCVIKNASKQTATMGKKLWGKLD